MLISQSYEGDVATFSSWELSLGDDSATAWDLYPETEYKVGAVVMDYDTGEFLTDFLFSEPFTTLAKTYADIKLNMDYGPYYDLGELIKAGQTQFEPLLKDGNAILPIKVTTEGNCSAYYYDIYSNDLSDTVTYPDEIFYAGLEYGCSRPSSNFVVKYDTPMTLVAVAYDYNNNPTELYRDVLYFTQDEASPAKDYISSIKKSSSAMAVASGAAPAAEVKVASKKRDDVVQMNLGQDKHEEAMAKVEALRSERLRKEVSEIMTRRSRFIAR